MGTRIDIGIEGAYAIVTPILPSEENAGAVVALRLHDALGAPHGPFVFSEDEADQLAEALRLEEGDE